MIIPDPTVRLRLATRIHFALLRHCGESVGVSTLLNGGDEAREALWVCQASGNAEMVALALQFTNCAAAPLPRHPSAAERSAAVHPAAPQDAVWGQDTSGFGVSRPADESEPAALAHAHAHAHAHAPVYAPAGWFNPANWRRRDAAR